MTAGFNFNYAAGFCSATPALRGNEVNMDFDAIMKKAYEEYFEGLAEGEEALSFSEFEQALSSSTKSID
ncbi:TPA: hypothetical protein N7B82_000798 [Escherichia coli]|nr:hypothetical protein [Escherichia coli]HCN9982707.1 hypothetical protein [Escherichia coli]